MATRAIGIKQQTSLEESTIEPTRWSLQERVGAVPKTFTAEVLGDDPVVGDSVKIEVGYDTSALVTLLNDATVGDVSGGWRANAYWTTFAGREGSSLLLERAPEKTIIYLGREYVDKLAKGYDWKIGEDQRIEGVLWWNTYLYDWRIKVPEIPDHKNFDGTFETVIVDSHHQIIDDLAGRLGMTWTANTPDLPFRRALTIEPTATYFESVRGLVELWNPLIFVRWDTSAWRLFILDIEAGTFPTTTSGHMELDPRQLQVQTLRKQTHRIVNRARIVSGYARDDYAYSYRVSPPHPTGALEITPDYEVTRTVTPEAAEKVLEGSDDYSDAAQIVFTKRYAVDPHDQENRVLLEDEIKVYEYDSQYSPLLAKKLTKYHYHDYTAAVGESVEEWHRVRLPGDKAPYFRLIKTSKTKYGDYIEDAGEIEREVVEEGLVAYDYQKIDGEDKRLNASEVHTAVQSGTLHLELSSAQSYQWVQTRRKLVRYDVEDYQRIRRDTTTFNNLNGTVDLDSEYIPINYDDRTGRGDNENWNYWEYVDEGSVATNGNRPRVDISVPDLVKSTDEDIDDKETADELWERIKRKSGAEAVEARVVAPVWLPALLGDRVTIKAVTYKELVSGSYTDNNLPAGTYFITGVQHDYQANQNEARLTTTLSLKKAF